MYMFWELENLRRAGENVYASENVEPQTNNLEIEKSFLSRV